MEFNNTHEWNKANGKESCSFKKQALFWPMSSLQKKKIIETIRLLFS